MVRAGALNAWRFFCLNVDAAWTRKGPGHDELERRGEIVKHWGGWVAVCAIAAIAMAGSLLFAVALVQSAAGAIQPNPRAGSSTFAARQTGPQRRKPVIAFASIDSASDLVRNA